MWPFDQLRRRRYKRRYNAALVVLLGTYVFAELSPDQRKRVELEADANMNRTDTPAAAWRKSLEDADLIAAFRAVAMEREGIALPAIGLSWAELFQPWSFWRVRTLWPGLRGFDVLPIKLISDFRPMHPATADAEACLRRNGLDIPGIEALSDALKHQIARATTNDAHAA